MLRSPHTMDTSHRSLFARSTFKLSKILTACSSMLNATSTRDLWRILITSTRCSQVLQIRKHTLSFDRLYTKTNHEIYSVSITCCITTCKFRPHKCRYSKNYGFDQYIYNSNNYKMPLSDQLCTNSLFHH